MPSPSTLPIKSAEANRCRFACNSSGSTRTFVPSAQLASSGSLTTPPSTVPVNLISLFGLHWDIIAEMTEMQLSLFTASGRWCSTASGAAAPPYRDFGLKAARQHSPTGFVVGRRGPAAGVGGGGVPRRWGGGQPPPTDLGLMKEEAERQLRPTE